MQSIGPYRILDAIGRGGMGVVYRAQNPDTGQLVALKTVLVPDQSLLQSIRREIHALARIQHPGIVRIVAEGLQNGLPWYAMQLLEGLELRQYCSLHTRLALLPPPDAMSTPVGEPRPGLVRERTPSRLWTLSLAALDESTPKAVDASANFGSLNGEGFGGRLEPETTPRARAFGSLLEEPVVEPPIVGIQRATRSVKPPAAGGALPLVLTTLRRLCAPLAFLHGEGIVHRDLKPSNVLVLANGRPVLMDFGLVSRFGGEVSREELDVGEVGVGTVGYMAPEQIRGELLDARADLYSLGCILYELVTGRQPFVRATVAEVARAHLKASALPASEFVDGVSPELDGLILQLLAKRPQDRLGHADAVAAALAELGAEDEAPVAEPRPRPYLYRPGFAGRGEPLAILEAHLKDLGARRGAIVLVGGESGVGKTRLAMELAHKAATGKCMVLAGECLDVRSRPLEALRKPLQTIADRCRAQGQEETERLLGPRGKLLSLYEPGLAGLPGQERYPEPAELQGPAAVARLQSYVADTLEALAATESVVLILDDLQWADELVLGSLEFLARAGRLDTVPLLVVATYRTEEVNPRLERLLGFHGFWRLGLGRLREDAVAAIVGDMLGLVPPPQSFSRFLARQSEGNPFFVAEYLRTAVADGLLWRDSRGRWRVAEDRDAVDGAVVFESLALPRSLRDLVERRLFGLPAPARRLAEAAAILGRESELALLRQLLDFEDQEMLEATSELIRRQVLEELGASRLRLVHDKIREVAESSLPVAERRKLHSGAARAMRALYGDRGEPAGAIARHHDAAAEIDEARTAYEHAAEDAARRYANEEALRLYRRADELWEEADRHDATKARAALALGEAQVRRRLGRYSEAEEDLKRAAQLAEALGDRRQQALALLESAEIAWRTSSPQETERLADEAEAIGRAIGDPTLQSAAARHRAIAWFYQGHQEDAIIEMERGMSLAREGKDAALELQVTENLASLLSLAKRLSVAVPLFQDLVVRHRAAGSRERLSSALNMLGQSLTIQGQLATALECLHGSLEEARAISSPDAEMRALGSLANCYDVLYQVYRALDAGTRAAKLAKELGDRRSFAVALQIRCRQLRLLGEHSAARELIPRVMEAAQDAKLTFLNAAILAEEAYLAAAAGMRSELIRFVELALAAVPPEGEIGKGRGYEVRITLVNAALTGRELDLAQQLVSTMQRQIVEHSENSPAEMGWSCIIAPALMLAVRRATGDVATSSAAALHSAPFPNENWEFRDWIGWGKRQLNALLDALPEESTASFLAHPDHRLNALLRATEG